MAPGTGKSWTFTVDVNGSPTGISCAIADSATACQDSDLASVSAGDRLSLKSVPSGSPSAASVRFSTLFAPNTDDKFTLPANANGLGNGDTYVFPFGDKVNDVSVTTLTVAAAGTVSRLFAWCDAAVAGGSSRAFTAVLNGTPQSLTATMSAGESTKSDTSNSFAVVAKDRVNVFVDATSTPGSQNCAVAMTFDPTTSGQFLLGSTLSDNSSVTSGSKFQSIHGFNSTRIAATNTDVIKQSAQAMTVKSIAVSLNASHGGGTGVGYTLNKNGSNTSLTTDLSGSETSDSASTDVSVADDDMLSTDQTVSAGTPGARATSIGYAATIP